jgi:hypothetical protein
MSDSNENLTMGPSWGTDTKTGWPTDRRSQNNLNLGCEMIEVSALQAELVSPSLHLKRRKIQFRFPVI